LKFVEERRYFMTGIGAGLFRFLDPLEEEKKIEFFKYMNGGKKE